MENKKTILIVDDEIDILDVFSDILTELDYLTETAMGYEQALRILEDKHIDLVISDVRMPGKDGIELLKKIKAEFRQMPVIISSGFTDYNIDEILELGAVDFIKKPLSLTDLSNAVEKVLG